MADAPQNALPLLYKDLVPLSSVDHASWKTRQLESAPWLQDQHAIPVTVDEFASAQRFFPIIFSAGDSPVPLALPARSRRPRDRPASSRREQPAQSRGTGS